MQQQRSPVVEISLKTKLQICHEKLNGKKYQNAKGICTLLYSHLKPERGIATSCNGVLITLSINVLISGGCEYQYNNQNYFSWGKGEREKGKRKEKHFRFVKSNAHPNLTVLKGPMTMTQLIKHIKKIPSV